MTPNRTTGFLRKLFKETGSQPDYPDDTDKMPVLEPITASETTEPPHPSFHDLQVGLASDPGRIRKRNEDAGLAWQFTLALEGQPPVAMGLFVVADGMGGHTRGEQASALATRLLAGHVARQICLPQLSDGEEMIERVPINEVLETGVHIAHQAISRRLPEAGTTMTVALVLDDGAYIAHVGDSRAYLGERGHLQLLTSDHSVAARLVEMGQATQEEALSQRNILYKAVGQGEEIEPDIMYHHLQLGQYLLLCCDGLWGKVSDEEIAATIEMASTPDIACQNLIARANENGGEDNISVVLVARGWPLPERTDMQRGRPDVPNLSTVDPPE
jgi:serine/threonine protein phosphatase PrpC